MGMKNEKKGFFSRMLSSEHKVFETSMFGISVVLTLALVIGIGYYISVAFFNHNTVTDEEANASAVSDSAVTVRESPEPTQTPDENTMRNWQRQRKVIRHRLLICVPNRL